MAKLKDAGLRLLNRVHETLFRMSNGHIGGRAFGMPVLALVTVGRKSGQRRRTMLTSPVQDGTRLVVVASYAGDDRDPAWLLNIRANPDVEVRFGGTTRPMQARELPADERAELWPRVVAAYRGYARYQRWTSRDIPLVVLEPPS